MWEMFDAHTKFDLRHKQNKKLSCVMESSIILIMEYPEFSYTKTKAVMAFSRTGLQKRALRAFAAGKKLPRKIRRRLSRAFGGEIPLPAAWQIIGAYAAKQVPETREALNRLTLAWLTVGAAKFDVGFRLLRGAAMIQDGLRHFKSRLDEFVNMTLLQLKRMLGRIQSAQPSLGLRQLATV